MITYTYRLTRPTPERIYYTKPKFIKAKDPEDAKLQIKGKHPGRAAVLILPNRKLYFGG